MQLLTGLVDWLEHHLGATASVAVLSVLLSIGSLWAGYRYLVTIPPDYFNRPHKAWDQWRQYHPILRWTLLIGKNILGSILIAAGIIMLFTPGQGILSLILGIALIDFPGKRRLERYLVQRHSVLTAINKMRAQAGQPPLCFEPQVSAGE